MSGVTTSLNINHITNGCFDNDGTKSDFSKCIVHPKEFK